MATVRVRVNVDLSAIDGIPMLPEVQADMDARAGKMLRAQQQRVPVDTGRLRHSLQIRRSGNGRQIGSFGVDYAIYVETGFQHHRSKRFIPGQPYLRPSIDAAR